MYKTIIALIVSITLCYTGSSFAKIAYTTSVNGNLDIIVAEDDGSGAKFLVNSSDNDYAPVWSPSGNRIAFVSGPSGGAQLWVINSTGTSLSQLTFSIDGIQEVCPDPEDRGSWENNRGFNFTAIPSSGWTTKTIYRVVINPDNTPGVIGLILGGDGNNYTCYQNSPKSGSKLYVKYTLPSNQQIWYQVAEFPPIQITTFGINFSPRWDNSFNTNEFCYVYNSGSGDNEIRVDEVPDYGTPYSLDIPDINENMPIFGPQNKIFFHAPGNYGSFNDIWSFSRYDGLDLELITSGSNNKTHVDWIFSISTNPISYFSILSLFLILVLVGLFYFRFKKQPQA